MTQRVYAVFPNRADAEQAVDWLRSKGVPSSNISVLAPKGEEYAGVEIGRAHV